MQKNITGEVIDVRNLQNHFRKNAENLLSSRETTLARQQNPAEEKGEEVFQCETLDVCEQNEPDKEPLSNCVFLTQEFNKAKTMDKNLLEENSKDWPMDSQTLWSTSSSSNYQPDLGCPFLMANKFDKSVSSMLGSDSDKQSEVYSSDEDITKIPSQIFINQKDNQQNVFKDESIVKANGPKELPPLHNLYSEDMRISRLLRRLSSENDIQAAIELCEKLESAVRCQSNASYIRRSFDFIAETLISILKRAPDDCCVHVARIFGILGYVNRADFRVYKNWIVNSYESTKNLKIYIMQSLKVTLSCDNINLSLKSYSIPIITLLKQYLERADTADTFVAVSDVIVEFSNNYKKSFLKHFNDVVDIIVGWHLEFDQTAKFKKHCSDVMQHFSEFFLKKVGFTFNLMKQIIEDIEQTLEKTKQPNKQNEPSTGSFIDALNSVIKSFVSDTEVVIFRLNNKMMTDAFFTISSVAVHCFETQLCMFTINSINEFFSIFVTNQDPLLIDVEGVQQVILRELVHVENFEEKSVETLLYLILVTVQKLKTQLTVEFISMVVDPNGPLSKLKMLKNEKIFNLLMKIFHEILLIKNVAILQEVYKNILIDIRRNIESISDSNFQRSNHKIFQAECILNFYIVALSVLATQTSSIMAMYALNPSILGLLINECKLKKLSYWSNNPCLYKALLNFLITHCKKNRNYILSSKLFKDKFFTKMSYDDTSPTSGNFEIILNFIAEVLTNGKALGSDNLRSLLDWIRQIIIECSGLSDVLINNNNFNKIAINISVTSIELPMECVECINELQNFQHINQIVLENIKSACCLNITSTKKEVRDKYTKIYAKLPLIVSLSCTKKLENHFQLKQQQKHDLYQWYMSTGVPSNIKHKYFKKFIENISIENSTDFMDKFLKNMVKECWVYQNYEHNADLYKLVTTNTDILISWAQWELAQYCVNHKLRTSLGNPQETFLKIESIVKEYARILANKETNKTKNIKNLIVLQKHANILLGFLEYLEKAIYNAAKGTAFALPSPEKPAKTFFNVNIPTCNEWFNRIRGAVNLVGIHTMECEMVIRYSEAILKNLVNNNNRCNDVLLEHTLTSFSWSLIRCGESETLHGLYTWIKLKTGKKYHLLRHAAEHAAGHREKAADGYRMILNSKEEKVENHIREFALILLIDCLYFTSQWKELHTLMKSEASATISNRETMLLVSLSKHEQKIMENLEESSDLQSILDLNEWDLFNSTTEIDSNFSYHRILNKTEETMINLIINGNTFEENSQIQLNICEEITNAGLQECIRLKSKEHLQNFITLNHIVQKFQSNEDLYDVTIHSDNGPETLTKILRWSELFNYRTNGNINFNLLLNIASLARKSDNFNYCKSQLTQFFKHQGVGSDIDDMCSKVLAGEVRPNINDKFLLRGYCGLAKWLVTQPGKEKDGINLVANCCLEGVNLKMQNSLTTKTSEGISRMLLTLSEWLAHTEIENLTHIQQLLTNLDEISDVNCFKSNQIISNNEMAIGKILNYSVINTPNLSSTWSAFGNWCYRWGKKIVEAKYDLNADKAGLSENDIDSIKRLIPNATQQDIESIVSILNQHQVTTADDEEIGSNEISSTELIENQLRQIEILSYSPSEVIPYIIEIWRQAYKSVYNYYEMAADAYFRYLNLATCSEDETDNKIQANCSIVTATLRLLRLVVKHALGLQEVLEEGLSTTPTRPWKVIIPQLFSRLNHHETYVRDRVSELLCRVAKDSPHLIIFPAVVGAVQEDKIEENSSEANPLTFCFNSLLSTLSKQTPETVKQVHLLVRELKRVTLLWEEYWMHSLAQLYSEYSELFNSFEAEIKKSTEQKHETLRKKYEILMSHVADDVKRFHIVTSRMPETNYERIFQEKYTTIIETTIADLIRPLNLTKPNESWLKIKQLYGIFQQKIQKNSQTVLKMNDISPVLANMKNTAISMPGVETNENNPIFITSVDSIVYILPTKTKPKKLAFLGSNGKKYTYLFKGLEDLHLDERIMQFLSISNSMMRKDGGDKYTAHHYSVIPLGPRSGLISWVDGVTPMFGLYKKWQHREAANIKKDKEKPSAVVRPSEMFYAKLTPLLAEHNIKTNDVRKLWPLPVLKKVLEELTKETPRDLFAKELWCHSNNCASWRESIRTYSRSVAVMSVIGYVIGLGDRHLDNVLVKLTTGEIVHIDYNVCFEKGKTLRVPEKVPFRMTQNLEEALGVTGVEGTFRLTCEYVLKTLRKERETLLTLLEAFVYDPLVDWAVSDDGTTTSTRNTRALAAAADIAALGVASSSSVKNSPLEGSIEVADRSQIKKKIENDVMRATLISRFSEIKPEWTQYRTEVNDKLSEILMYLDDLNKHRLEIQKCEEDRELLTKELALVKEVQMLGTAISSHPLNSISQRYASYKMANENFTRFKEIFDLNHKEIVIKKNFLTTILLEKETDLRTEELTIELNIMSKQNTQNEFDYVKSFLESSAQSQLYIEANQARIEMDVSLVQQMIIIQVTSETLTQYFSVMRYYPKSLLKNHRYFKYDKWCNELMENADLSSAIINEIYEYQANENSLNPNNTIDEKAMAYAIELEKLWLDTNFKVRNSIDRVHDENLENANQVVIETKKAIEIFTEIDECANKAINISLVIKISQIIEELIQFEESCRRSMNGFWQLPLSLDYIFDKETFFFECLIEMTTVAFGKDEIIFQQLSIYIDRIKQLKDTLEEINEMETFFSTELAYKIIEMFMLDDETVNDILERIIAIEDVTDLCIVLNKLQSGVSCIQDMETIRYYNAQINERIEKNSKYKSVFKTVNDTFNKIAEKLDNSLHDIQNLLGNAHFNLMDNLNINILEKYSSNSFFAQMEVRKLQTLSQMVATAKAMVKSFKENDTNLVLNGQIISNPVSRYVNHDFISLGLLGQGSIIALILESELENICNIDLGSRSRGTTGTHLVLHKTLIKEKNQLKEFSLQSYSRAEFLCQRLLESIEIQISADRLKRTIAAETKTLKHLSLISTAHFWINDQLHAMDKTKFGHIIYKHNLLQNIQGEIQNLTSWKISIEKIACEINEYNLAVVKRLKWNVASNQNLVGVLEAFLESISIQENRLKTNLLIAQEILDYCSSVVSFEMLQVDSREIIKSDENFINLVKQWYNIYTTKIYRSTMIDKIEEAIVQLLDPEGNIEHGWLTNILGLLDELYASVQNKIADLEKALSTTQDNLQRCTLRLQSLTNLTQLKMDVRFLLKLIIKIENSCNIFSGRPKQFQLYFRLFLSKLEDLNSKIISRDYTEANVKDIRESVNGLLKEVQEIYDDLIQLVNDRSVVDTSDVDYSDKTIENREKSESKKSSTPVRDVKKGNMPEQKRNAYAVSVWRRIRMKLEGRDPDPNRRFTVAEQVDWMIREAINPDNLAVLYEGWTPWV